MSDIYPDDSASHTSQLDERNARYAEDIEPERTQESEAVVAERVRSQVREYLDTEDKLKRLLSATRTLRKRRKELHNNILADMHTLDVENLDLKKGKLVARRSRPKVPLTRASIKSVLSRHYNDENFIQHITDILYSDRDRTEKVSLSHYTKRGDK